VTARTEPRVIGRIAFRVDGDLWNCYYAKPDTMEGALHLGSVRMALVNGNIERRQMFIDLMKHAVAELMEVELGSRPTTFDETRAPPHERSGHG